MSGQPAATCSAACCNVKGSAAPGGHEVVAHHGRNEVAVVVGLPQVNVQRPLAELRHVQ
jgi:hypothetical protein